MRRALLLTALLIGAWMPAQAGHSPPKVIFRIHVQTPGEGQSPMEVSSIAIPPDGDTIQIRSRPEVTEHELIKATQDNGVLRLYFNHVGKINLSAVTAQNQGRVLVVIINGQVIYAPIIDEQVTNGELDIPHPINPAVVQLLDEEAQQNLRQAQKI
jgi:hypothetical protein